MFCHFLLHTGARISEALDLRSHQLDLVNGVVILLTLKKRRPGVYRSVPVPRYLIENLLSMADEKGLAPGERLWSWSRTKAWNEVKAVMRGIGLTGPHACPKGLRHGFGVAAIQAGVPLNLVSKWLGHADLNTTAVYTNALGEEERFIAERLWTSTL